MEKYAGLLERIRTKIKEEYKKCRIDRLIAGSVWELDVPLKTFPKGRRTFFYPIK